MKTKDRVYIIPTRFGMMYGFGILVTLMAGAIYMNNLVYLLSFFLVALFLIGMVQTNANLRGLDIEKILVGLVEEEGNGAGVVWLKSFSTDDHHQVKIRLKSKAEEHSVLVDKLEAGTFSPFRLLVKASKRGRYKINKVNISTVYPFGLFYAWKNIDFEVEYFVFPKPVGSRSIPDVSSLGDSTLVFKGQTGDDFSQHKKYKVGDSQKHVDWKAFARGRPKLIKEFSEGQKESVDLDINEVPGNVEARLRQLSKWIHICTDQNLSYSLNLGGKTLAANFGPRHKEQCLKLLAEFEVESA